MGCWQGNLLITLFQSTLLQEERLQANRLLTKPEGISIHAPTRGATKDYEAKIAEHEFQSTLLQEERQYPITSPTLLIYFNPRSYKRSDHGCSASFAFLKYFNPRSYKRSDTGAVVCFDQGKNFNPRSYKRSDNITY